MRGSLRRDDETEREVKREMAFHVEMSTRRNIERGMPAHQARRQARLAFGSAERFREESREAYRLRIAEDVISDIRFALRGLRRSPSFGVTAVLTIALGVGASTAMFTVLNAVLLRPLPIPDPEDFTYVGWSWSEGNEIPALTSFQYEFVRTQSRTLEAVAAYRVADARVSDASEASPVAGLLVSSGFFRALGFSPRLGRAFDARELQAGGPAVVILGDGLWRGRFGGDPGIIGRQVRVDGELHTVVGVLPAEFRFPPAPEHTGYLVPLAIQAAPVEEGNNTDVIGRLRRGTSHAARTADLRAMSAAFRGAYPSLAGDGGSFRLFTHDEVHITSATRHTLWVLSGAVSLVLLIACANTATLLLVRAAARRREIAVRASIGAGPGRIARQLFTEGLVLSFIATTVGVLFSIVALRSFLALAPTALPVVEPWIDLRVLVYAIIVTVGTGLAFGLTAAVPAHARRLRSALPVSARDAGIAGTRIRETLVLLETTVAVVLLGCATLLGASFGRLILLDPGFDADRVIAIRLGSLPPEYDAARRERLVDRLLERIRELPGVERAAAAPSLPLERGVNFPVDVVEHPERASAVELRHVSPDYLATLGVPLRAGRDFDRGDVPGAEPVAIVNEAFARHFWDDASPLGRFVRVGHFRDRWRTSGMHDQTRVIGVAADIREVGLDRGPRPTVLLPRAQAVAEPVGQSASPGDGAGLLPPPHTLARTPVLLVRSTSSVPVDALRGVLGAEDPRLTVSIEPLASVASRSVARPRFRTLLVAAFAGFALLLTAIGIYGVIASVVEQRRREIGIRLALGANHVAVATAVVRRCLANVMAGALVGLLAFVGVRSVLASWLYDIAPGDPRVLAVTLVVLASVAACASWIPARRATHIDPATSLRLE